MAPSRALGSTEKDAPGARRFMVDFASGDLAYYAADPSQVEVVATSSNGAILRANLAANPHIDGFRAMIDVDVNPGETTDLRVYLRAGSRTLTETWTFPWTAPTAPTSQIRAESRSVQKAVTQEAPDMHAAAFVRQPTSN
jgi:glucans biosynthesis protein